MHNLVNVRSASEKTGVRPRTAERDDGSLTDQLMALTNYGAGRTRGTGFVAGSIEQPLGWQDRQAIPHINEPGWNRDEVRGVRRQADLLVVPIEPMTSHHLKAVDRGDIVSSLDSLSKTSGFGSGYRVHTVVRRWGLEKKPYCHVSIILSRGGKTCVGAARVESALVTGGGEFAEPSLGRRPTRRDSGVWTSV